MGEDAAKIQKIEEEIDKLKSHEKELINSTRDSFSKIMHLLSRHSSLIENEVERINDLDKEISKLDDKIDSTKNELEQEIEYKLRELEDEIKRKY